MAEFFCQTGSLIPSIRSRQVRKTDWGKLSECLGLAVLAIFLPAIIFGLGMAYFLFPRQVVTLAFGAGGGLCGASSAG